MKRRPAASILMIVGAITVVGAAEKIDIKKLELRTLPAEIYSKLHEGKRASLLWRDTSFVLGSAYSVEKTEWLAAERNGGLFDYVTKEAQTLGQKEGGEYRVQIRVTDQTGGSGEIRRFGRGGPRTLSWKRLYWTGMVCPSPPW